MGWTRIERLDARNDVLESQVQNIFDAWGSSEMPAIIAGAPKWLWTLGKPKKRKQRVAYGYPFTPDVLWHTPRKAVVAELKYGTKYEPLALAEVLHHAHMLRQLDGLAEVTPLVVTQYNGWMRAAAHELQSSNLRHLEIDLLNASGQHLLWVSDPHAAIKACAPPKDLPLDAPWKAKKWWRVTGEETWLVQENPQQPINVGHLAIISKICSAPQGYVLWRGQMPGLRDRWTNQKWHDAGDYWIWSPQGNSTDEPLPPHEGGSRKRALSSSRTSRASRV
jgi:hypothetical protein